MEDRKTTSNAVYKVLFFVIHFIGLAILTAKIDNYFSNSIIGFILIILTMLFTFGSLILSYYLIDRMEGR